MLKRLFQNLVFSCLGVVSACAASAAAAATFAQAVTPQFTNVLAGHSIVIAARFLNAAGQPAAREMVTFGNDACGTFPNGGMSIQAVADANGVATTTFTARYPGGIMCRVSASAGAFIIFDVVTYNMNQVQFWAETVPAEVRPGQPYALIASIRMWNFKLTDVDIAARIVSGSGTASLAPGNGNSGTGGAVTFYITPESMGDYEIELTVGGRSARKAISSTYQGVWWGGEKENGWGMTLTQHGNRLAAGWYYYDSLGHATWSIMPGCVWNAAFTDCTGTLFNSTGAAFNDYTAAAFRQAAVGTLTLSFADATHATLSYVVNGVAGQKALSRLDLAAGSAPGATNYTDVWWGGIAQNGWGIALAQQQATLVGSWYTYDSQGRATWFVMNGGSWTSPSIYQGNLVRATASALLGATYDAQAFTPLSAGTMTLNFSDANNAVITCRVDGVEQTKAISRLGF